jgi:hypothetical protein
MIPKTTTQNILLWLGALTLAVALALISSVADHWPEGGAIDWRLVYQDVSRTIVSLSPIVAAGLGLPALGKEAQAFLAHQVGQPTATAALEQAATVQATSDAPTPEAADILADRIYERIAAKLIDPPERADASIGLIDQSEATRATGDRRGR